MNVLKTVLAIGSAIGVDDMIKSAEHLELNDILGVVGLERKPTSLAQLLPALGLITVSAAVGAGVALLLAPSSGSKLRERLSDGLGEAKHKLSDSISQIDTKTDPRHAIS